MIFPVGNTFYQSRDIRREGIHAVVDVPHEYAAEQEWPPASLIGKSVLVALAGALGEVDPAAVERARGRPGEVHAEVAIRNPYGGSGARAMQKVELVERSGGLLCDYSIT